MRLGGRKGRIGRLLPDCGVGNDRRRARGGEGAPGRRRQDLGDPSVEVALEREDVPVQPGQQVEPAPEAGVGQLGQVRVEIDQARLLTLKAAHMMDTVGNKAARTEIAMIKVVAPNVALNVIDRAIQAHGGAGVSSDTFLAEAWASSRTLRLADGPDEVHREAIARWELRRHAPTRNSDAQD